MEFNKAVSNPMLVGCIELMRDADTPDHRIMFAEELRKASLLTPAVIEPAPVTDEDGTVRMLPGSNVNFPLLSTVDGKKFCIGFTDSVEYRYWAARNGNLPFFALGFQDYMDMIFSKDSQGNENPVRGLAINPLSDNVVIPREMLMSMFNIQMGMRPAVKKTEAPETKE